MDTSFKLKCYVFCGSIAVGRWRNNLFIQATTGHDQEISRSLAFNEADKYSKNAASVESIPESQLTKITNV